MQFAVYIMWVIMPSCHHALRVSDDVIGHDDVIDRSSCHHAEIGQAMQFAVNIIDHVIMSACVASE